MQSKLLTPIIYFFLINPFIFSGGLLSLNGSDVSVYYIISFVTYFLYKKPYLLIALLPLVFLSQRSFIHSATIIFLLYVFKPDRLILLSVIRISLRLWMFLALLEFFVPSIHEILFSRTILPGDSGRGMRIFAPEPTIAAVFILSIQISFSKFLGRSERLVLLGLSLLTLNPISFVSIAVHFKKKILQLALISGLVIVVFLPKIGDKRVVLISHMLLDKGIVNTITADRSMNTRANGLRELGLMVERFDIFGYDYSQEFAGIGNSKTKIQASAGMFVSLHELGIFLVFLISLVLVRIRSLWQVLLFALFLVVGSLGHLFPLFSIVKKYD